MQKGKSQKERSFFFRAGKLIFTSTIIKKNNFFLFNFFDKFRFSDWFDKILLLVGLIGAFASALMYPFMHFLYGEVAGVFVDYMQSKSTSITTSYTNSTCK